MQDKEDKRKIFKDVYEKEADSLFRYCSFRVSSREESIDITEESFTRFWQAVSRGSIIDNPKAYIFSIARNLIIDWYRRKKAESLDSLLSPEDGEMAFDIADPNALSPVLGADGRQAIKAIAEVSPSYREAVYLRFVEDMPPREVAEALNLSPNAVSIRIDRGLKELRKILKID